MAFYLVLKAEDENCTEQQSYKSKFTKITKLQKSYLPPDLFTKQMFDVKNHVEANTGNFLNYMYSWQVFQTWQLLQNLLILPSAYHVQNVVSTKATLIAHTNTQIGKCRLTTSIGLEPSVIGTPMHGVISSVVTLTESGHDENPP